MFVFSSFLGKHTSPGGGGGGGLGCLAAVASSQWRHDPQKFPARISSPNLEPGSACQLDILKRLPQPTIARLTVRTHVSSNTTFTTLRLPSRSCRFVKDSASEIRDPNVGQPWPDFECCAGRVWTAFSRVTQRRPYLLLIPTFQSYGSDLSEIAVAYVRQWLRTAHQLPAHGGLHKGNP